MSTTNTNTPNKNVQKKQQAVVKKKKYLVFKDTIASPYLNQPLSCISKEYSENILNLLKQLLSHDVEKINDNRMKKKLVFQSLKTEFKLIKKCNNRINVTKKKIQTLKDNIKKEKAATDNSSNTKKRKDQDDIEQYVLGKLKNNQDYDKLTATLNELDIEHKKIMDKIKDLKNTDIEPIKQQQTSDSESRMNQFWIGVNKITRELEKTPVHTPPNIRLIIVCPNQEIPILTSHLPIMAYMRRIPICLISKDTEMIFSNSIGLPNTGLALAIKETKPDEPTDEALEDFVRVSIEASKSVNSLDFPWLPQKYTSAHLTEPIPIKYVSTKVIKEGNKRIKL
ncbi:hypothetical protein CYY_000574 [Polysphondylium violaceum]|uniref:Ribosomal protein L7Ae/L30e/S12e/Gadd45 domain-containing protein n=1 Tax=Polysphondylium violaceum TaxID=133409 RepID=A0A8J4V5F5_9MYCE|nr:hypothetical protein CYY_000574 [Polysphondylium violaceum]